MHHSEELQPSTQSPMLGEDLIAGIVVPAMCGLLGRETKDHYASFQRFESLEVHRCVIVGYKVPTVSSQDAEETLLVSAIYFGIFDFKISHYINGYLWHTFNLVPTVSASL